MPRNVEEPPVLRPGRALGGVTIPPGTVEGRELHTAALEARYATDAAASNPPKWVERYHTIQRRRRRGVTLAAHRNAYFKDQYNKIPSPVRREWEAEAHMRWPRPWHDGQITGLDVYANDDEIYYVRRKKSWSMPEAQIRALFQADYASLSAMRQSHYIDMARSINHARNYDVQGLHYAIRAPLPNPPKPDVHELQRQNDDLLSLPNGMGHTDEWRFGVTLGQGGYGSAVVWRRVDAAKRTIYRVVLKRDLTPGGKQQGPRNERRLMARFRTAPPAQHCRYIIESILEIKAKPNGLGRLWLKYAPYGDLGGLIRDYEDHQLVFPEPFVWYVFNAMAKALLFLESGRMDPTLPPIGGWAPTYHIDIKPVNILLGAPESFPGPGVDNWHAHYPKPILGDFGVANEYPAADAPDQIPLTWQGEGTQSFMPFEQMENQGRIFHQRTANRERVKGPTRELASAASPTKASQFYKDKMPEDQEIRIHTSVYQLGVIVWCLMTCVNRPSGKLWKHNRDPGSANQYPAWWDALPRHRARRPWPYWGAPQVEKDKWDVLVNRGFAEPETKNVSGAGSETHTSRDIPRREQKLGKRSRSDWDRQAANQPVEWVPHMPGESMKPHYSSRLVELAYKCMSGRIEDRPTPAEVVQLTDLAKADILNRYPNPPPGHENDPLVRPRGVILPQDKFPLNTHVLR